MSGNRAALLRMAGFGAASGLFSLLVIAVRLRWVPLESVDRGVAHRLNELVAPSRFLVQLMGGISRLGSFGVLAWLVIIGMTLLAVRKQFRLAGFLLATTLGGLVLDPALKLAIGRLRPVVEQPIAHGGGNSFPSGHALNSFVCYGALLLVFLPAVHARWRRPVLVAAGVLVALIGFSRLALGVHFLSDVIGAWSLGVAWVGLCAAAFELIRYGQGRRVTEPLAEGLEPEAVEDLRPTQPHGPGASAPIAASARAASARAASARAAAGTNGAVTLPSPRGGTTTAEARADADGRARGGVGAEAHGRGWVAAGLVVAWVLTFGALVGVGVPLARYHHGNGNLLWDSSIPHWFAGHRFASLGRVSIVGSEVGNTHSILAIGLVVGAVALAAVRRWRPVVFLVTVMFGELTLFLGSAAIVGRARPDVENMDGPMPTSSFPSGHVAATICMWSVAAVLALPRTRAWWRWLLVAAAVLMPLWVAVARTYRGMHHPTDILGSCLLAALWLVACWWLLRPNQDLTERPAPARAERAMAAAHA
ncbi:phosphatase PAP2 family protein [Dactylosporangium sp. CA-092794]|uniref:phosphatase PAP2 family protein n=1 Tax=Dactylosporangium sp. CA-092794 TaxID=3239929 RepID=UPI003D911453